MFAGHDQVGRQRQLKAPADGQSVDRGDHRLGQAKELRQSREAAGAVIGIDGLAFGRGVQIPARAEKTPRAGDDPHAQRRVLVQTLERGEQRLAGGHVDGVGLGSIQSDRQHAVAYLGMDTRVQNLCSCVMGRTLKRPARAAWRAR